MRASFTTRALRLGSLRRTQAAGVTQIADIVVPEIFTPYVQQETQQKARIVQAGILARNPALDGFLVPGGLTFNVPSFRDLDDDDDNVSSDDPGTSSTPNQIATSQEIAVRLSRNNSWSSMDLAAALAGTDPMRAIASRVAFYWARRLQRAVVATLQGVFADNAAAPAGADTHAQDDLTVSIIGGAYSAGVTDFSAEAFIDAATTLGDSADEVTAVMVHSIVYSRMQKNNLIEFVPDSEGRVTIPTFLGRRVVVDDGLPNPAGAGAAATAAGIYHTWLFGPGALSWGVGSPKVPTEVDRAPAAGNGAGQETLFSRVEWCVHPSGHAYIGTSPVGGPSNAATANNLANLDAWRRVWPERKQIKIARLITRES